MELMQKIKTDVLCVKLISDRMLNIKIPKNRLTNIQKSILKPIKLMKAEMILTDKMSNIVLFFWHQFHRYRYF